MKIALCLKGKVGNKNKYATAEPTMELAVLGHKHFKENLLDHNDVDVFMHCWDKQFKDELIDLYNPKGASFQEQVDFTKYKKNLDLRSFSITSYWYSVKKVFNLLKRYEQKHGFKYDCVILSRYDMALMKQVNFVEENFNLEYFYHNGPDPLHVRSKEICWKHCCDINGEYYEIGDMFFFSNSDNMHAFSSVYDYLDIYKPDSPHRNATKHLKRIGLFDKRKTFLDLYAYNYSTWNGVEDGTVPLVRWVYDMGAVENENTFGGKSE